MSDPIKIGAGPRITKLDRLAVEFIAARDQVPMMRIYQRGVELLVANLVITEQELTDYYGQRGRDVKHHLDDLGERGRRAREEGEPHA